MRLTDHQAQAIMQLAHEIAGERAQVRVFGSRLETVRAAAILTSCLNYPSRPPTPRFRQHGFPPRFPG